VDLEPSTVASVPLETPKGAQRPLLHWKDVPLDHVRCTQVENIQQLYRIYQLGGLKRIFLVCCGLFWACDLPSWGTRVTWVVSHVRELALIAPLAPESSLFEALSAFIYRFGKRK
jgi:hypothetical protein